MTATIVGRLRGRLALGTDAFDRRLIPPMALGAILNPINSTIIAVTLVPIGIAFGAPPAQTAWLVSALYLTTAVGQPIVGRLVDSLGPRRLYLAGATLTGTAGLLGMLAPTLGILIVARVILGFGTCAGYPAAMYLIRSESERTGRHSPATVLTILAVSSQTVAVIGPTLGGLLVDLGGWRTTFALNIPLAFVCLILGWRRLPPAEATRMRGVRIDVAGVALFVISLVSLLLLLMHPALDRLWLLAITGVAATLFVLRELSSNDPFIDLRILRGNIPLLLTFARTLVVALINYSFLYGYTQWLEDGHALSATHAGLVLLPGSMAAVIISIATGRQPQIRGKLMVGQSLQAVACATLLLLDPSSPIWLLVLVTVVRGIPQGLNNLANQNAVYFQADPQRIGASAGLMRTFFYLGAIGAAAANGVFYGKTAGTPGLHHLGLFTFVVGSAGLALTVVDRSLARVGRPPVTDSTGQPATE